MLPIESEPTNNAAEHPTNDSEHCQTVMLLARTFPKIQSDLFNLFFRGVTTISVVVMGVRRFKNINPTQHRGYVFTCFQKMREE